MKEKALYFIAIVPPEPLFSRVMELKHYFAEHFMSRKALKSPPHITLRMPFKWRQDREERIFAAIQPVLDNFEIFTLVVDGFGFFEPRVVYLSVEVSDRLHQLHGDIDKQVRASLKLVNELGDRPFRPHMTVAFRDLKKPQFYQAQKEFSNKEFNEEFEVSDVCLLKHNGGNWDIYKRFPLSRK